MENDIPEKKGEEEKNILRIKSLEKWNRWFYESVKEMRHYQNLYRTRFRKIDAAEWRKKMNSAEKIIDEEIKRIENIR